MIRVMLGPLPSLGMPGTINFKRVREMKKWCRENFGTNPRGAPQIWRGTTESVEPADADFAYPSSWMRWVNRRIHPVFYFVDQKHATAFLLRWG